MGKRVFAAKILSQDTEKGMLDWRAAYDEIKMETIELSSKIERFCINIVRDLGLVFGCLDLVVTPSGDYVFLEVNESGQFLWIEHYTEMFLLDAFCEFLIQANIDFTWTKSERSIRCKDIADRARRRQALATEQHVAVPPRLPAGACV